MESLSVFHRIALLLCLVLTIIAKTKAGTIAEVEEKDWDDCPSGCDYCVNGSCRDWGDDLDLAVGWIIAIVVVGIIILIGIPICICFCCGFLCFKACKSGSNKQSGQIHQQTHFQPQAQYPQQTPQYPGQPLYPPQQPTPFPQQPMYQGQPPPVYPQQQSPYQVPQTQKQPQY